MPVIHMLQDNGVTSRQALMALQVGDLQTMGILQVGQVRLIEHLIKKEHLDRQANNNEATGDVYTNMPPTAPCTGAAGQTLNTSGTGMFLNKKGKHLDIVDFVPMSLGEDSIDDEVWGAEGCQLILKMGKRKIALEDIKPMQWSAANLRIMFQLINEGSLSMDKLYSYLVYTMKVSELAIVYKWTSVLAYDRAYRQAQAREKFEWGNEVPHIDRLHLRHREDTKVGHTKVGGATRKKNTGKHSIICRNFQQGKCVFGDQCSYQHTCIIPDCHGDHPASAHPAVSSQQGNLQQQK